MILFLFLGFSCVAQKYKLDSLVHTVNDAQYIVSQKYDQTNGKAEIIRYERIEPSDTIQKLERTQVQYDVVGNESLNVFSIWDPTTNSWDEQEKTLKEFNFDNKLIHLSTYSKINKRWEKVLENKRLYTQDSIIETDYGIREEKLLPINKSITVMNTFHKVSTHEIFNWNDQKKTWQQLIQTTNQYQNDSILVSFQTLKWNDNLWQKHEKCVYESDIDSLRAQNYTLYNGRMNSWIPIIKFEKEELPEQNKKINRTYKWSLTDEKWMVSSQTEIIYNKDGKEINVLLSELDSSTNEMKVLLEKKNFYDQEGRCILFQNIDYSNEELVGTKNIISFDKDGNVIQVNAYEWNIDTDSWRQKMISKFFYDKNIELNLTNQGDKNFDMFGLNEYNYITNKYAIKRVKMHKYKNGVKTLDEDFDFFYSISK